MSYYFFYIGCKLSDEKTNNKHLKESYTEHMRHRPSREHEILISNIFSTIKFDRTTTRIKR